MLSFAPHPFILVLGIVFSQALVIQFVNSVVISFGLLESSMVLFSSVSFVAFSSLLAADCMIFFLVLLSGQCLYRGSVLWCYDHC